MVRLRNGRKSRASNDDSRCACARARTHVGGCCHARRYTSLGQSRTPTSSDRQRLGSRHTYFRQRWDSKGLFAVNAPMFWSQGDEFRLVLDYGHVLLRNPGSRSRAFVSGHASSKLRVGNAFGAWRGSPRKICFGSPRRLPRHIWDWEARVSRRVVSGGTCQVATSPARTRDRTCGRTPRSAGGLQRCRFQCGSRPLGLVLASVIWRKRFGPSGRLRAALNGGSEGHVARTRSCRRDGSSMMVT